MLLVAVREQPSRFSVVSLHRDGGQFEPDSVGSPVALQQLGGTELERVNEQRDGERECHEPCQVHPPGFPQGRSDPTNVNRTAPAPAQRRSVTYMTRSVAGTTLTAAKYRPIVALDDTAASIGEIYEGIRFPVAEMRTPSCASSQRHTWRLLHTYSFR